ncbi:hypothetical protein [Desulfonatronovibrio magnus]|uniref:hypothetical protein n=1 Tax=Desulfonatronovibrio magnus TaxID=698827 RepID=UPI0005EAD201|nr:hypothetical protein [Desulfonatronovibrio magnus]
MILPIMSRELNITLQNMEVYHMATIEKIQDDILSLSDSEKLRLSKWLSELEARVWDQEIVDDFSQGGRANALLERVKSDYAAGKCSRWE